MTISTFGYPLNTLRDGVVGFIDKEPYSQPSVTTKVIIYISRGIATIKTSRSFTNEEKASIEAILTFPAPFESVLTGMKAQIEGRELIAIAQGRAAARETYEEAIDNGKTAILHEEVMRGIHVLSIGQLSSRANVTVETELVMPLANIGGTPTLRLPFTINQIYGVSPLLPADDLVTGKTINDHAIVQLIMDEDIALIDGLLIDHQPFSQSLTKTLTITFPETRFGVVEGHDAQGRRVTLSMEPLPVVDKPLNISVLFDRSGSTSGYAGGSTSIWKAMFEGIATSLKLLRQEDHIEIWDFDDECRHLGGADGPNAHCLVKLIGEPRGGTELGAALEKVVSNSQGDILILTDGNSWHSEVHNASKLGRRITSVLVGENSFEAMIGRLASLTGGQVFAAVGKDVSNAVNSAIDALRDQSSAIEGDLIGDAPRSLKTTRSGVSIKINWSEVTQQPCDAFGKYAAALALPLMNETSAEKFAIAHGICTHLTSLIIVDKQGQTSEDIPLVRKLNLSQMSEMVFCNKLSSLDINYSANVVSLSSPRYLMTDYLDTESFANTLETNKRSDLIRLAKSINWNRHANILLTGDLTPLDDEHIKLIMTMSLDDSIQKLAGDLAQIPRVVILALLAKLLSAKTAQRFSRRILAGINDDRIDASLYLLEAYV